MTATSARCRSCGETSLEQVLSLGRMPLANSLLREEDLGRPEPLFPLDLVFCPNCTLVQITETVPPETLFREYLYFSSFSDTMLAHARELVERVIVEGRMRPGSLAMEIASNDGYLLQYYKKAGFPVFGIEPAQNVARVAVEQRNIPTLAEFFTLDLARRLAASGKSADVLHANNVLAHVADLPGFVAGIREILADDGVAILEFPYLGDMIERCEFDTIYHEHLCYFSLSALSHLLARFGLQAVHAERLEIHGGSLLLEICRNGSSAIPDASVPALLAEESAKRMGTIGFYRGFARRVLDLKTQLRNLLADLKRDGKRVAAYGAAAKGSTLLNTFAIGGETIDFVVDRSTHKQGRYMPGIHVPIVAPIRLCEAMPDYTLLLTWNFADEILEQQDEYRRRGGKFIIPIPGVRII